MTLDYSVFQTSKTAWEAVHSPRNCRFDIPAFVFEAVGEVAELLGWERLAAEGREVLGEFLRVGGGGGTQRKARPAGPTALFSTFPFSDSAAGPGRPV